MKLLDIFKNNIDFKNKYIIAVSGGPDSMALLDCACKSLNNKNILVAHVNYNKRKDAYKDEQLIIDYCKKQDVECKILNVTEKLYEKYAKDNHNFQAQARNIRYDFFANLGKEKKIFNILLGHHKNDDAETYIMQKEKKLIINYYGIKKNNEIQKLNQDFIINRPFLNIFKKDIILYNNYNNIQYNIDYSNFETKYRRNKIRKDLQDEEICKIISEKNQKNLEINNFFKLHSINNKIVKKEFLSWSFDYQQRAIKKIISFYPELNKFVINKKSKFLFEITKQMQSNKSISFHLFKDWYIENNDFIEIIYK